MTTEVWMISRWDRSADHIIYHLDESEGVYLDRALAEAKIAELNQAERARVEEIAEREYQDRLSIWRRLAEPQRYTFTRTVDEYRLSDPLELHGRENDA